MSEAFVVSAVRTAIGDYGGRLKEEPPTRLAAAVVREAVSRAGVPAEQVGHVVFGNVIHTDPIDMYLARVAALQGGLTEHTPALTVNRLCGSGLQAVLSASEYVRHGHAEVAIGGGAESMSRALFASAAVRWGQRMGEAKLFDMMVGALTDPFGNGHMGITAENVAKKFGVGREAQDEFALESHRRAAHATAEGRFREQILPIPVKMGREHVEFAQDEHVRGDATLADLSELRPAFMRDGGTVTAGNASAINDGAAAVTIASEAYVKRSGATPLGRLVAYAHAAVDPAVMGIGPVPAVRAALARAGITVDQLDAIECNEAFASQACAVTQALHLDPARVNPNGGAIALGHPIGATGAILVTKLLYELKRTSGRYGLVTMCIGGGQGIAAIFSRD
ncbi:beta-ketothiolase BktB [Trinickia mobilis]|uniref:beta-ketothiolase BktB n=1 Tax=Trinickia mobilis TaxID=2816356 RepID=UPI001A8CC77C|nr:beta-ketothiolase BktB [Trinickia mobilis]